VERILGFLFAEGKERKKRRERPTIFFFGKGGPVGRKKE